MFAKYLKDDSGKYILDESGNMIQIRNRVVVDCQKAIEDGEEEILVEQSHKDEVDINKIVKRHGVDLIAKTAMLQSNEFQFDDVTGNDFQEAMFKITKAQTTFDQLPSKLRSKFNNSVAEYLDFVQNPDNRDQMIEMGLMNKPAPEPEPVQVVVTNLEPDPETPAE
jgi:hypothetical protein